MNRKIAGLILILTIVAVVAYVFPRRMEEHPIGPVGGSGNVAGTITDEAGNPIQDATVLVEGSELAEDLYATTDVRGYYSIQGVRAGLRTVRVTAPGYTPQSQSVNVPAGDTVIVNFSFPSPAIGGNIYYVSPTGSNSNPGTRERPWATPGYGSRQLRPGDTLVILGGRYVLSSYDDIITPPSGTPSAWITIKGEDENRPVLVGRESLNSAIDLSGVSYIRIENLEITHDNQASGKDVYFWDGVYLARLPASHIVLRGLYIHHIDGTGMNFQDINDLQVIDCRIEYCGFGAMGGPAAGICGWRNVKIQGCRLSWSGHYYQGIYGVNPNNPYDRPDGFGIEASEGPIEIVDTVAEHNRGDGIDSKAANTLISRCIVANNRCDGVKLWGDNSRVESTLVYGRGDGDPQPTPWSAIVIHTEKRGARFEIANVTVDDFLGHNYVMYAQYDFPEIPVILTIRNTIFCSRGQEEPHIFIGRDTILTADHNLFYFPNCAFVLVHGNKSYTFSNISELGEGNIYGDPLFVSPAWGREGDYHLRRGSPAIDAGTPVGAPSTDLEGTPRPQGNAYDIGAYES